MKKFLTWLAVGVMACGISFGAFANGPLLGVSVAPIPASVANLNFGWDFGDYNVEVLKGNLTTVAGNWIITGLWTPEVSNGFGYRAGVSFNSAWFPTFIYNNFSFDVGASKAWGPIQLYGELNFLPAGVLTVNPRVGVNFLFGDLLPAKTVE